MSKDVETKPDERPLRSLYAVRCECGRWTEAKGPRPVKNPRCHLHRRY